MSPVNRLGVVSMSGSGSAEATARDTKGPASMSSLSPLLPLAQPRSPPRPYGSGACRLGTQAEAATATSG